MEAPIESELLNEIVLLTRDYSNLRQSNFKWTSEKLLEQSEYEITTSNDITINVGWWSKGTELIQINGKSDSDSHWYTVDDLVQRMKIKRSREIFNYLR